MAETRREPKMTPCDYPSDSPSESADRMPCRFPGLGHMEGQPLSAVSNRDFPWLPFV